MAYLKSIDGFVLAHLKPIDVSVLAQVRSGQVSLNLPTPEFYRRGVLLTIAIMKEKQQIDLFIIE